jgi:site-specific recombinase XerD
MQMTHVIINFRRYLKRRNFSRHTVKYYLAIIKQYAIWLDVPLEKADGYKIDAHIDYLQRKRLKPASINLYLAIIRMFYNYLKFDEKVDLLNPVGRKRRLRVPQPLPKCLREQEIAKLFSMITNKRDIAMFTIMLRCGLRVEEVANLTHGAVDLKRRRIMVCNGKGNKDRVVYISADAHAALSGYIKYQSRYRTKKMFLVEKGTCKGQGISVRGIQKRMEYYAKKAGVKASCHCLRHTMATQLLNAEAEVETIQDLLGHNWITTTQRYCKVSNLKVQRDYFKAMRTVLEQASRALDNPLAPGAVKNQLDKTTNIAYLNRV